MKLSIVILVFIAFYITRGRSRLEYISKNFISTRKSLSRCVGEASHHFFKHDKISLVSLSTLGSQEVEKSPIATDGLLFLELFRDSNISIVVKKNMFFPHGYEKYYRKVDNYIIQFNQLEELQANLNSLKKHPAWNPHAKFLVISPNLFQNPNSVALQVSQQLWNCKIVNGVVLLRDPNIDDNFVAYSWLSFSESECLFRNRVKKVQIVDECKFGNFKNSVDWFPNKIKHDLQGCPFQVRAIVWPPYVVASENSPKDVENGLEVKILQTMAEVANFSVHFSVSDVEQDWGSVAKNGSASGALFLVINETYDIAIGSFAGTTERHTFLDSVTYNIPESLTWCVSHAEDAQQWKKLLMVIPTGIWYFCVLILCLISLCLWGMARFTANESTSYKSLLSSLQNTFSVFVNMAVKIQPKTTKIRLLFLLWAFFTLHIAVLYQSTLISVLTKPKYEQQIKTIYDIFDKNLSLWMLVNNKRYFRDDQDFISVNIMKKFQMCNDIEECLDDTAFNKKSATCTPRLHLNYIASQYMTKKGRPLLYCFKESIVTYPLEMYVTKGFPLRTYFNTLVGRITASGLITHWEKEIFDSKSRNMTIHKSSDLYNDYQLALAQLQLIFIILLIGHFVAFIIFIFELCICTKK